MQKKIFVTACLLLFTFSFGQSHERKWGTMIPIYNKNEKAFSPVRQILKKLYIAEVNQNNGNLYIVSDNSNEIIEFKQKSPKFKSFYKIPGVEDSSSIEQIKFDSKNNLIISGKTSNADLATNGAFSKDLIATFNAGNSFVAKIDNKGKLLWFSYFYEIPLYSMSLTIDKNDNIYILNKRFRGDIFNNDSFQQKGDIPSKNDFQDALTKLNPQGDHIWSTFYSANDSQINSIAAGDEGFFVYGMHPGSRVKFFGDADSSNTNNKKTGSGNQVFISKFNFDGERLWSSYFGNEASYIPYPAANVVKNPTYLTVIKDDVYFVTLHNNSINKASKSNLATDNVYLSAPPFSIENHTLTKFSGNGQRVWTTYLKSYAVLFKSLHNNELILSATINDNYKDIASLTTNDAYQLKHAGMQDVYTYALSLNGKELNYNTFYGFNGNDVGFSLPTFNGYYTLGYSSYYNQEESLFATRKAPLNKFTLFDTGIYVGNFLGYFSKNGK